MPVIGIDIGGTKIKIGVISQNKILKKIIIPTRQKKAEIIKDLINSVEKMFNQNISAIGIGCPGPSDYKKGIIGNTPNLPLTGVNLKQIIAHRFKKKVVMDNDANCFALGESLRLRKKNLLGLTLGTGVGGGIIIDGQIYHGNGNAGEFGCSTIKFDEPSNKSGRGSLEAYLSAKAIQQRYHCSPLELSKRDWVNYGGLLGIGLANFIHIFDPEIIVLGGGISHAFSLFKSSMNQEIKKRTKNCLKQTKVKIIQGNADSGILGAAALVS